MQRPSKIIVTGEGGQGVQTLAVILAKAAYLSGKEATYVPNYGVEQRGGVSVAFVQICSCDEKSNTCGCEIGFPKFNKADILINLRERAIARTKQYVDRDTIYVYESSLVHKDSIDGIVCNKVAIPAVSYATKNLDPKVFNIILLGVAVAETDILKKDAVLKAMDDVLGHKFKAKPELRHLNRKALDVGIDMIRKIKAGAKK